MVARTVTEMGMPTLDFADLAVAPNPFAAVRALAGQSWIARLPAGFMLLRHADCTAVSRDDRWRTPDGLGLVAQGVTSKIAIEWASSTVFGMSGEQHRRVRRLALPAFSQERGEAARAVAARLVREIYGRALAAGHADVAQLNNEYVARMICNVIGFPDVDWEQVSTWADDANQVVSVSAEDQIPQVERTILALHAYTERQLERLRREPGGTLAGAFLAAEEDGDRFTHSEIVHLIESVLMAGAETTKRMLSLGMWLFTRKDGLWERLAAQPQAVPSAVEELLRTHPPFVGTQRVATEDIELNGVRFPRGTHLFFGLPAANEDPRAFGEAHGFDLHRYDEGRGTVAHLSFGTGFHLCLGRFLARVELQEALRYLPGALRKLEVDARDAEGVLWSTPFGVHGPIRLPMRWDPN